MGCGKADWARELRESVPNHETVSGHKPANPARFESHRPISATPVDAHSQMLAARVEGLEKELNGLQHVWGRVKALEAKVASMSVLVVPADTACSLLRRCLNEVSPVSLLARDIAEFLRNR